jgi:methylase of polypeptide subunit release factors
VTQGRKPGTALDWGMGQGRNAIYLAGQGWDVTGVDISDVAVEQAKKNVEAPKPNARAIFVNLPLRVFFRRRIFASIVSANEPGAQDARVLAANGRLPWPPF